jgi:hypothetical protein
LRATAAFVCRRDATVVEAAPSGVVSALPVVVAGNGGLLQGCSRTRVPPNAACVRGGPALKFASRNVCWWRLWVVRSWRFENSGIFQACKRNSDVAAPLGMLFFCRGGSTYRIHEARQAQ